MSLSTLNTRLVLLAISISSDLTDSSFDLDLYMAQIIREAKKSILLVEPLIKVKEDKAKDTKEDKHLIKY